MKTHIIDSWFFVPDCHYLGVWAFLSVVRYNYIPSTPKDAYTGKYRGLEKRHTITIAFLDETRYYDYRQQNRAVLVEYWHYSAGPPERIPGLSIEVFYSSCMNMIAERTRNVKSLADIRSALFFMPDTIEHRHDLRGHHFSYPFGFTIEHRHDLSCKQSLKTTMPTHQG